MKCVVLQGSPRKGGNCEVLVDEIVANMEGYDVNNYFLDELDIEPCHACGACGDGIDCVTDDDGAKIIEDMLDAVPRLADSYKVWPGWKYLPMGSNFEMIFYRNGKGEVLVKMLRNEEETTIPAISTYKGPYYRWNDLEEYLKSRLPR